MLELHKFYWYHGPKLTVVVELEACLHTQTLHGADIDPRRRMSAPCKEYEYLRRIQYAI